MLPTNDPKHFKLDPAKIPSANWGRGKCTIGGTTDPCVCWTWCACGWAFPKGQTCMNPECAQDRDRRTGQRVG
jgi:hypothetical protein